MSLSTKEIKDLNRMNTAAQNSVLGTLLSGLESNSSGSYSGSTVYNALLAHINLSGSDIHKLGTISIQSASAVNITGGIVSNITFADLNMHIAKSGSDVHALGTQTGINLKIGAGNLHSVMIGGVVNGAVLSLVDNTSGSAPVIYNSGAMPNNTNPFSLDFKGLPFYTGLRLIMSTQNCIATVIYE